MATDDTSRWDASTRALLDARTRAVASEPRAVAQLDAHDALGLRVAGERYAIAAHAVRGVAAFTRLTSLPHAPPEVAGLIARGGEIMPAFHLRAVLRMPLGALPEYSRVVLMGEGADALALVVDAVEHFGVVEIDALREVPAGVAPAVKALLRGIDRRGVPVLDHVALLACAQLFVEIPVPREAGPLPPRRARRDAKEPPR